MIEHPTISRKHAEISFSWNGAFVKDLESANGVYCNDSRIDGTYELRDRDEIRLGQPNRPDPVRLVFSNPAEALLSKIEEAQITDTAGSVVEARNITDEASIDESIDAAPVVVPGAPVEISEAIPDSNHSPVQPVTADASQITEPAPVKKGMSALSMGLLIGGVLVLILSIAAIGFFFYADKKTIFEQTASPAQRYIRRYRCHFGRGSRCASRENSNNSWKKCANFRNS